MLGGNHRLDRDPSCLREGSQRRQTTCRGTCGQGRERDNPGPSIDQKCVWRESDGVTWPNHALEPTPYSLRSCLASASGRGSPRALGAASGKTEKERHMAIQQQVKWTIEADCLLACNCDYGCPCEFDAPPTQG